MYIHASVQHWDRLYVQNWKLLQHIKCFYTFAMTCSCENTAITNYHASIWNVTYVCGMCTKNIIVFVKADIMTEERKCHVLMNTLFALKYMIRSWIENWEGWTFNHKTNTLKLQRHCLLPFWVGRLP